MQIRYYELIGKRVVDAEGHALGRLVDLAAEQRGDALAISALRIGPRSLLDRIASIGVLSEWERAREIPWERVDRVGTAIYLRPVEPEGGASQSGGPSPNGT